MVKHTSFNVFNEFLFFFLKKLFYNNYKNILFVRFNLRNNITLTFLSNKLFFWFDLNSRISAYTVLSKFELSFNFDDNSTLPCKNNLLRLVYIKKKFGFFKKDNKINHYFLHKANFLKNFSASKLENNDVDLDTRTPSNKFFDLKLNKFRLFYKNRKLIKKLILLKDIKQKKTTKILSKLVKSDFNKFVRFVEFSLYNILLKAKLCYTLKESLFLIKNGFIFLNGLVIKNQFATIKKLDVIQLIISDSFFEFLKINCDKKYKLTNSLKHILWKNHRFINNFYKQSYNRVPDWVSDISFFYEDVPNSIEIDYTTLSLCVLDDNINSIFYNNNFLNFLNVFMLRNYNWNYLT